MLTPEEWEQRKQQVGASDVPKLFNFDNLGAKRLWRQKVGLEEIVQFENQYTIAGNITEEPCLQYAFEKIGIDNYTLDDRVEHPSIPNFVVSLDGYIVDDNIPVENKSIKHSSYARNIVRFNERGLEDTTYYRQLQAQISALNASGGWLIYNVLQDSDYDNPILYEPSEFKQERRYYKRDDKMIQEIENRVRYMLRCMQTETEPSEKEYKERSE